MLYAPISKTGIQILSEGCFLGVGLSPQKRLRDTDVWAMFEFLLKPDETYTLMASAVGLGAVDTILTDSTWNGKKAFDLILKPTNTAQGKV